LGDKSPPLELVSVMTLGDGTLLDRLKRCQAAGQRGIPRTELMEHLRDAVKGLQFLNDHDVQHCDVKPENLLVVGGSVQVCDYGSALRSIYAREARTSQGYTEQYAAPEQLGARRIKLHKTTDLYALAITYYALRTGKFPWSDHADEPIPVLKYDERFDFSALARISRFRFEADVLRRALRRDPKQRQQSVSDLLADLERAIDQEAAADAAARRQRRRLAGWAAVAVLLIGLASLGAVYRQEVAGWFRRSSDRERLALVLSQGHWGEALDILRKIEASGDDKAIQDTSGQVAKALDSVPDVPGADGRLSRALQVP
jgi:serine/threonine protein kinase